LCRFVNWDFSYIIQYQYIIDFIIHSVGKALSNWSLGSSIEDCTRGTGKWAARFAGGQRFDYFLISRVFHNNKEIPLISERKLLAKQQQQEIWEN
jgi:hypothetical protein